MNNLFWPLITLNLLGLCRTNRVTSVKRKVTSIFVQINLVGNNGFTCRDKKVKNLYLLG